MAMIYDNAKSILHSICMHMTLFGITHISFSRWIIAVLAIALGSTVSFAEAATVDTLCDDDGLWNPIMEWFVECEGKYLECFGGDILQPIGWSMWHDSTNGWEVIKVCDTDDIEAYTASYEDEVASTGVPMIARLVLLLLIAFGIKEVRNTVRKKEVE